MRIILIIFTIFVFSLSLAYGEPAISVAERQRLIPIAESSLRTFIQLIDSSNYKTMGFDSIGEAGTSLLGAPLKEYMVRLDSLKKFDPNSDPHLLLIDTGQVTYPVMVINEVKSSIKLAELKGEWKAVAYGSGNLYKLYERSRTESARRNAMDQSEYFEVRIPALSLFFLGYNEKEKLMLISVLDDQGYGFKTGESMPAERVFETLIEPARRHDGLPR